MHNTIHFCNGKILCDPKEATFSRSLTIRDSVVTEVDGPAPINAEIVELEGNFAAPGFVDSHLHLTYGASSLGDVDLTGATSKDAFLKIIAQTSRPSACEWIVGFGWSDQLLGGFPDKDWLLELGDSPAIFYSLDLHTAVVNEPVLALLDIPKLSLMPGSANISQGIIREDALFDGIGSILPALDSKTKLSRTRSSIKRMQEQGITLVGTMETIDSLEGVLSKLSKDESMRFRAMCLDAPSPEAFGYCSSLVTPFLKVTGFKAFLDGSLGSRTAKMYNGWIDTEGSGEWAGVAANNTFDSWLECVAKSGYSPVVHAIGDQAVGLALDAMASVPKSALPRIEHAQFIAHCDLGKVSGQCFGVQPLHYPVDARTSLKAVGEERMSTLHNWRGMVDAGATLSFGSDWPVAEPNPLAAMRIGIEQGLSAYEVVRMSTSDAADSLRSPKAGRLTVGSYGDVAILDRDPYNCDWSLPPPSVIMTFVGGRRVFEGGSSDA